MLIQMPAPPARLNPNSIIPKQPKRSDWGNKFVTNAKRKTLYEFDWQVLRISLDFSTLEGFQDAHTRIEAYLERHNRRPRALYKVINLMAAVAMGLHSITNSSKPRELLFAVQSYREELSVPYKKGDKVEDWSIDNEVRVAELASYSSEDIHKVKRSLTLRWIQHEKSPKRFKNTRPELDEYIHILERELIRRANSTFTNKE